MVGLGVYTTIIIFIDAITLTGRGDKGTDLKSKIFYSYLIILLIATIILAFYLMTHN
ncbi:LasU family protein [Pediococcus ethanolidurans]|uniref:LasU family protein n=1 Tax=Pediococcus ethanolidurans TaxID=319653 RepID=UPI001C65FA14